jgi:hypothetical protein
MKGLKANRIGSSLIFKRFENIKISVPTITTYVPQ